LSSMLVMISIFLGGYALMIDMILNMLKKNGRNGK